MKKSLIAGGAFLLALAALTTTADARMGAGGSSMTSAPSRMSGGDMRLNTSNIGSPRTFSPDGRVRPVTFSPDGNVSFKPLKVKPAGVHRMNDHSEDPKPQAEPKPKPQNGSGGQAGNGGTPPKYYGPKFGYHGKYGYHPYFGGKDPVCKYRPC